MMNQPLLQMRVGPFRQGLYDFIHHVSLKGSPVVEIGTFAGESAQIFAEFASLVYTIDPWVQYAEADEWGMDIVAARHRFFVNVMAYDRTNTIKPLQVTSEQASKMFAQHSMPLVYIDGWHKHTAQDIDLWWDKVAPDGDLAGHDYNATRFPCVIESIALRFGAPDKVFQDETWVVKKTPERMRQWQSNLT
jgi:hypothetical protein